MATSSLTSKLNILVLAFITGLAVAGYVGSVAAEDEAPRTISVTGLGEVSAKPDMATINVGVTTSEKTAKEALEKNNAAMMAVFEAMDSLGIPDTDIQTSGFSVYPRYARYNGRDDDGNTLPEVIGYEVQNSVSVKIKNLDDLGGALDRFVTLGANQVNGISFGFADPKGLETKAKQAAVANAKANAELYAKAAGVTLGRVLAIQESSAPMPPIMKMERAMAMDMGSSVPIAAGESTVSATISMIYEIE